MYVDNHAVSKSRRTENLFSVAVKWEKENLAQASQGLSEKGKKSTDDQPQEKKEVVYKVPERPRN